MGKAWRTLALVACCVLSGCTALSATPQGGSGGAAPAVQLAMSMDGRAAPIGQPLSWNGSTLTYSPSDATRCGPDNCEVKRLDVPKLDGAWTLQVALDWARTHESSQGDIDAAYPAFNVTVRLPNGSSAFQWGTKFGNSVLLPAPPPGEYEIEVQITHWWEPSEYAADVPVDTNPNAISASYQGTALLFQPPARAGALLPDLVIRDIGQARIEYPPPPLGNRGSVAASPAAPGCTADEVQETGASRCLRFSVAVGNDGAGPFVLSPKDESSPDWQLGLRSQEAEQCVANADGTGTLRPAGTVTYSVSHGHNHYDRILGYEMVQYDITTGQRGKEVAKGAKLGYGPYPEALLHEGRTPGGALGVDVPCAGMPEPVGLNAGWYDYYLWWRTSQYIDVGGVPDGVYELVATINPEGHVLESDSTNNAGSIVIKLTGDHVETLRPFVWAG